jgi:general L-amino acid transport system permease protein
MRSEISETSMDVVSQAPVRPWRPRMRLSLTDEKFLGLLWQMLVIGAVAGFVIWLWTNTVHNLNVRRIATGYGFLSREAGMPIADSWIAYNPKDTYLRALMAGVANTLRVALVGILLATVFGTLIGIARLSSNWLMARLSAVYIEVLRDLPLLLQLLFWYVLLQGLPPARQAWQPVGSVYLSNRGLMLPALELTSAHAWVLLAAICGFVVTLLIRRWARARQMQDGRPRRIWPYAVFLIVGAPAVVSSAVGATWVISRPELRGFNFSGGLALAPEYFALVTALTTYTAAFIAEIARAGILAVSKGQWEAGAALGLRRGQVLQKVVLPQALRVIIPPLTSQYLNLTKNSSLAVAIGYQDIVSVANTTLNQTGQAIEAITLIMAVFLTISLSISLFMNWYNARIALVER